MIKSKKVTRRVKKDWGESISPGMRHLKEFLTFIPCRGIISFIITVMYRLVLFVYLFNDTGNTMTMNLRKCILSLLFCIKSRIKKLFFSSFLLESRGEFMCFEHQIRTTRAIVSLVSVESSKNMNQFIFFEHHFPSKAK